MCFKAGHAWYIRVVQTMGIVGIDMEGALEDTDRSYPRGMLIQLVLATAWA